MPQPWGRRRNFLLRQEIAWGLRCLGGAALGGHPAHCPILQTTQEGAGEACSPAWGSRRKDPADPRRPHDAGDRTVAC